MGEITYSIWGIVQHTIKHCAVSAGSYFTKYTVTSSVILSFYVSSPNAGPQLPPVCFYSYCTWTVMTASSTPIDLPREDRYMSIWPDTNLKLFKNARQV